MIGDSLPVSRPNRERELGTSGGSGRHPPSAGPWQFKKERGGRPESAFGGLKATFSLGSCLLYSHPQGIPDFPICGQSRPRFPFPGRIRKRGISRFPIDSGGRVGNRLPAGNSSSLPVSRPNRESGERELGISGSARSTSALFARPLRPPPGDSEIPDSDARRALAFNKFGRILPIPPANLKSGFRESQPGRMVAPLAPRPPPGAL
jgi:hypothetical protein